MQANFLKNNKFVFPFLSLSFSFLFPFICNGNCIARRSCHSHKKRNPIARVGRRNQLLLIFLASERRLHTWFGLRHHIGARQRKCHERISRILNLDHWRAAQLLAADIGAVLFLHGRFAQFAVCKLHGSDCIRHLFDNHCCETFDRNGAVSAAKQWH